MIIERFLEWVGSANSQERSKAASALARAFLQSEMDEETREETEAALTLLMEDVCDDVRLTLAREFAAATEAPRHIIMSLIGDKPEISTLILSQSPALLTAELVDVAAQGTPEQQIAVACRDEVPAAVCAAIAQVSCLEACLGMLMNEGARPMQSALAGVAKRFGDIVDIRNVLMKRSDLLPETRVLLIEKLGVALGGMVKDKNWMGPAKSGAAVQEACDKAAITFIAQTEDSELDRIIADLIERGRITPGFLLRAICMGNITLVARSIAQLAEMPNSRVEAIISQGRSAAFKAAYLKAGLPARAFGVFASSIDTWRKVLGTKTPVDPVKLPVLVTRQVLAEYPGNHDSVIDDLLVMLRKLSAEASREAARAKLKELQDRKSQLLLASTEAMEAELVAEFEAEFEAELMGETSTIDLELTAEFESALEADGLNSPTGADGLAEVKVAPRPVPNNAQPSIIDAVTGRELEIEIAA